MLATCQIHTRWLYFPPQFALYRLYLNNFNIIFIKLLSFDKGFQQCQSKRVIDYNMKFFQAVLLGSVLGKKQVSKPLSQAQDCESLGYDLTG